MLRIISGKYRGRYIKTLSENNTRPTTNRIKESLFNIIQNHIAASSVLDLFSGSGSLGLEALSRGSNKVVFVEKNRRAFELLRKNCLMLDCMDSVELLNTDALKAIPYLGKSHKQFDIIFIDPPYDSKIDQDIFPLIEENKLVSKDGIIVYEHMTASTKAEKIGAFVQYDNRNYGYTSISFYRKEGENAKSSLSR